MRIPVLAFIGLCVTVCACGQSTQEELIKAEAYFAQEKFSEAAGIYQKLMGGGETDPRIFSGLALCLDSLAQYPQSLEFAQKAVALNPSDPESYLRRGVIYGHLGDYSKAAADFKKGIALNPFLPENYFNLGFFFFHRGKYAEARRNYLRFFEVHPGLPVVHFLRVTQEIERHEYPREIEACQSILKKNLKDIKAYVNLGIVFGELRQYEKATDFFNLATSLAPHYARAQYDLGVTFKRLGLEARAKEAYQKTVSLDRTYLLALSSGQFDGEAQCLTRLLSVQYYVGFADAYYHLGRLDCQLQDWKDLQKQMQKLEELGRYDDLEDLAQCQNDGQILNQ